jgi:hypothetical protein
MIAARNVNLMLLLRIIGFPVSGERYILMYKYALAPMALMYCIAQGKK